jgi:hypothetical protein
LILYSIPLEVAICILGQYETGWLVRRRKGGEEREVAAGARIPSHGVFVLPASESARSDSLVCAPLVLPLPPLVAAAQLIQMQYWRGAPAS